MKKLKEEIVFVYCELKKTFSNEPSYFSSKRIERSFLFMSALTAANYWFWTHVANLTYSEVIAFIATLLGFAGYTMATTQKEKKLKNQNKDESKELKDG
jgi:Ca2+/Na+ antiporter